MQRAFTMRAGGGTTCALLALGVLAGCDARFELLDDSLIDPGPGVADLGLDGGNATPDAGMPDGGLDDAGLADAGLTDAGMPDAGVDAGVGSDDPLFAGTFEDRNGYTATGDVTLEDLGDGNVRITLSSGFSTAAVPGPVLIVSDRDSIGRRLDRSRDIIVFRFTRDALVGAREIVVPLTLPENPTVFTYCEPFTVETGRALVSEVTR
ncbi:MAG: hypothetical protein AAGH15_10005 [Myxococcota bacterium]